MIWQRISKGDRRAREMADAHYTRQRPGTPSWTRPGYNHVLWADGYGWRALWCWWRPKWEAGIPGTERKDHLRVIECTLFRIDGRAPILASDLIRAAVQSLCTEDARRDLHIESAGEISGLITGVSTGKTQSRRSRRYEAGRCYRAAGWEPMSKSSARADVWLWHPYPAEVVREDPIVIDVEWRPADAPDGGE